VTVGANDEPRRFLLATASAGTGTPAVLTELAGGEPDSPDVHLFIVGALGERHCEAVADALLTIAARSRRVNVDLSEVSGLSAAGFGLLLRMHQRVSRNRGELHFVAVSPCAREVLAILNWNEVSQAVVEVGTR
jgi:anti-anti-sigma factor